MTPFVRLYGCFIGHSSMATVTDGWLHALADAGLLAGCCITTPVVSPGSGLGGEGAPVAIVTDIRQLPIAGFFHHAKTYVVLATHTCWLPEDILALLRQSKAEVLAPSAWVVGQMQEIAPDVPVHLVPHGVSELFRPLNPEERAQLPASDLYKGMRGPGTAFLHMAEGSLDRKSTYPLLEAFEDALRRGLDASLTIVASGLDRMRLAMRVADSTLLAPRVRVLPRLNAAAGSLRWVYSCFDFVVQPSRAEGFGMCPLEALCCGTPVVVTLDACGHREWADAHPVLENSGVRGGVNVDMGLEGPTEFDPEPAPTVTAEAIAAALKDAYEHKDKLKLEAEQDAADLARHWVWPNVTRPFLSHLEREFS